MKNSVCAICSVLCGVACAPLDPHASISLPLEELPANPKWSENQLDNVDPDAFGFGWSLAIVEGHAWVGTPDHLDNGSYVGAVFEYTRSQGVWQQPTSLVGSVADAGFGAVIAASKSWLAIASYGAEAQPVSIQNRASSDVDVLVPPAAASLEFGASLALVGESTLFVGDPTAVDGVGRVFHYERGETGEWEEQDPLAPSAGDVSGASFGRSLAGTGDILVIGAPTQTGGGAVYTSQRGLGGWSEPTTLQSPDGSIAWGTSLALDETGQILAVGDRGVADETGVAHVLSRGVGATFTLDQTVTLEGGAPYNAFGQTIALSRGVLFVGAPGAQHDGISPGVVQDFASIDGIWTSLGGPLAASDGIDADNFGASLAVSGGGVALVGARNKVYSFTLGLGVSCSGDFDCESGRCVEGVCCNTACDGCSSCLGANNATGKDGSCAPVRAGTDPNEACEVGDQPCGQTGACDENGRCAFQDEELECAPAECTSQGAVGISRCDGLGECVAPTAVPCESGFSCREGSCLGDAIVMTTCASSDDCDTAGGFYCFEGECVSGARCSSDKVVAYDEDGDATPCDRIICEAGVCLESCVESEDCLGGLFCHPERHDCVPDEELAPSRTSESSCSLAQGRTSSFVVLAPLTLGLLLRARRRNQKARTNNPNRATK